MAVKALGLHVRRATWPRVCEGYRCTRAAWRRHVERSRGRMRLLRRVVLQPCARLMYVRPALHTIICEQLTEEGLDMEFYLWALLEEQIKEAVEDDGASPSLCRSASHTHTLYDPFRPILLKECTPPPSLFFGGGGGGFKRVVYIFVYIFFVFATRT